MLQTLMLIQEGILISIFFASLLSLIIADRIFKSQLATNNTEQQVMSSSAGSAAVKKELEMMDLDLEKAATKPSSVHQVSASSKKNTAYDF